MAEEVFNLKANLDVAAAIQQGREFQKTLDALGDSGSITTKQLNQVSAANSRVERTLSGSTTSVRKYSTAFSALRKEVSEAEKAMQSFAQKRVAAGSRDPVGLSANRMSLSDAQRNLATSSASNLSIESVSRERVALENRLNAAKKEGASLDQQMRNLGRDQVQVAKEKLSAANQELQAAQALQSRVSSGKGAGAVPFSTSEQVAAEERLTAAKKNAYAAQVQYNSAVQGGAASLPTLRYAMYDVSRTAGIMSAAILGTTTGLVAASASYESSFTAVERTSGVTGEAVGALRDDLLNLARVIPQSFGEISDLAARGAQLGVASSDLAGFTETVAQFVATSDTVTLDQAVEAFGRISNLMGDSNFNALGSAITLVGVNAAATEGQIVKTTQELAPFATSAGLATDEVIGLATAVASLGQAPERSRSAFLTLQSVMNNAIAGLNDKLPQFANLLGISSEAVADLWKNDPAQFISSFAQALGGVENMTVALDDLGLKEKRASQVFQALAADSRNAGEGLSVLDQAFADSNKGYTEGTELARQYGLIVDDLASKWQLFINAVKEVAAGLGDALAPAAKIALDGLTSLANTIADVLKHPAAKWIAGISMAVVGLGGVLLASLAGWAMMVAATAGLVTALEQVSLAGGTATMSMRGLSATLTQSAIAAGVSTRAINGFKVALASTGIGLAVVALGTLATAFMTSGESAEQAFNRMAGGTSGLAEALALDAENFANGVIGSYTVLTPVLEDNSAALDDNSKAIQGAASILGITPPVIDETSSAIQRNTDVLGDNAIAWLQNQLMQSEAFKKLGDNAEFVDYMGLIGANFVEVTRIAASEGEDAVLEYFLRLERAYEEGQKRLGAKVTTTQGAFDSTGNLQAGWMGGRGLSGGVFGTKFGKGINDITKTLGGFSGQLKLMQMASGGAKKGVEEAAEAVKDYDGAIGDAGNSTEQAAEKIYTLKDYASDLAKVWGRAFEIRFSGQQTIDTVQNSLQKLRDAAEASAKRVTDLRSSIRSLSADSQALKSDISILEYYLRIANEYGDTKRATAIEAELAKKRAELSSKTQDLADKNKELKKEQDSQSKTLVGNSQAARDNRKTIEDLVQQYQAHIGALAASGMSQEDLARATQRLKADFIQQATQLGYNRKELGTYAKAFDDVAVAIKGVPRNVTVNVSGLGPAQAALKEFEATLRKATNNGRGINIPVSTSYDGAGAAKSGRAAELQASLAAAQKAYADAVARGADNVAIRHRDTIKRISGMLNSGNYWSGGYTGPGGKYEPKGIVHGGEYVFRKDQVNQSTGLPHAGALLSMLGSLPSRSVAPSAAPGGGGGTAQVALTAGTIQAIAQAVQPYIVLNDRIVGEASSKAYAYDNTTGAY